MIQCADINVIGRTVVRQWFVQGARVLSGDIIIMVVIISVVTKGPEGLGDRVDLVEDSQETFFFFF